jgi:hypothetical protein
MQVEGVYGSPSTVLSTTFYHRRCIIHRTSYLRPMQASPAVCSAAAVDEIMWHPACSACTAALLT